MNNTEKYKCKLYINTKSLQPKMEILIKAKLKLEAQIDREKLTFNLAHINKGRFILRVKLALYNLTGALESFCE